MIHALFLSLVLGAGAQAGPIFPVVGPPDHPMVPVVGDRRILMTDLRRIVSRYNFRERKAINAAAEAITDEMTRIRREGRESRKELPHEARVSARKHEAEKLLELSEKRLALEAGATDASRGQIFDGSEVELLSVGYLDSVLPVDGPVLTTGLYSDVYQGRSKYYGKGTASISFMRRLDDDTLLLAYEFHLDCVIKSRTRQAIPQKERGAKRGSREYVAPKGSVGKNNRNATWRKVARERADRIHEKDQTKKRPVRYTKWTPWTERREPVRETYQILIALKGFSHLHEHGVVFDTSLLDDTCFYISRYETFDWLHGHPLTIPVMEPIDIEAARNIVAND